MKKFALSALASALLASSAFAADLGVVSQPVPETYIAPSSFSWTGAYVGLNGGFGWGEVDSPSVGVFDVDGGVFGAQIGYNYDLGGFVLGAEADVQWSGIAGETTALLGTEVTGNLDYF